MEQKNVIAEGLKMMEEAAKQANTVDAETKDKLEEIPKVLCPCCKNPTLSKPIEVKGELLDHYLSCVITGTPFSHAYPIYQGRLTITVTQLSNEESILLDRACSKLAQCFRDLDAATKDSFKMDLDAIQGCLRTYVGISLIEMTTPNGPKIIEPARHIADICHTLADLALTFPIPPEDPEKPIRIKAIEDTISRLSDTSCMSAIAATTLIELITAHNYLYTILMDAAFDANFWKGIELA